MLIRDAAYKTLGKFYMRTNPNHIPAMAKALRKF